MKLKETAEDLEVKERLWGATVREVREISERYAAAHEVGVRETERQYDIVFAAKKRGYPMGLVRDLARSIRCGKSEEHHLNGFRDAIGL